MKFSDPTNFDGLIELLGDLTNTQNATSSSYALGKKTRDINNAYGHYFLLANQVEGRWQVDDDNQTDYPIITGNLVAGQQDYSFATDANGNQILDIYKVRILGSDGVTWHTIKQRDVQDKRDYLLNSTVQSENITMYDLMADGIFLTDIPSYSMTNGIEIYISRTPSYFAVSDTNKQPGIPKYFHEYLAIRPAYFYNLVKNPELAAQQKIVLFGADGKHGLEQDIKDYYAQRNRDERPRMQNTRPQIDPYFRKVGPNYGNSNPPMI